MKKRLLATLLALSMAVSMLPTVVFAEGEVSDAAAAVSKANLNNTASGVHLDSLETGYTADVTDGDTVEVALTATSLTFHKNDSGAGDMGAWMGINVVAPDNATGVTYYFGADENGVPETDNGGLDDLYQSDVFGIFDTGFWAYVDASLNETNYLTLTWTGEGGFEEVTYKYEITCSVDEFVAVDADGLQAAFDAPVDVTLGDSFSIIGEDIHIDYNRDVVLDLAGNTITAQNEAVDNINVGYDCSLTVLDSLGGGQIISNQTTGTGYRGVVDVKGDFTLESGTISSTYTRGILVYNYNAAGSGLKSTVTIDGGSVSSAEGYYGIQNAQGSQDGMNGYTEIIVNGGEVDSISSSWTGVPDGHDVIINDGTVGSVLLGTSTGENDSAYAYAAGFTPALAVKSAADVGSITLVTYNNYLGGVTINDLFDFSDSDDGIELTYQDVSAVIKDGNAYVEGTTVDVRPVGYSNDANGAEYNYAATYEAAGIGFDGNTITVDEVAFTSWYASATNTEDKTALTKNIEGTDYYFVGLIFENDNTLIPDVLIGGGDEADEYGIVYFAVAKTDGTLLADSEFVCTPIYTGIPSEDITIIRDVAYGEPDTTLSLRPVGYSEDGDSNNYPVIYEAAGITFDTDTNTVTVDEATFTAWLAEDNAADKAALTKEVSGKNYYFVGLEFADATYTIDTANIASIDDRCITYIGVYNVSDGAFLADNSFVKTVSYEELTTTTADITISRVLIPAAADSISVTLRPDGYSEDGDSNDYQAIYEAAGISFDEDTYTITVDEELFEAWLDNADNTADKTALTKEVEGKNYYFVGLEVTADGYTIDMGTTTWLDARNITYIAVYNVTDSDYLNDNAFDKTIAFDDSSDVTITINRVLDPITAPIISSISTSRGSGYVTVNWTVDNGGSPITEYTLKNVTTGDEYTPDVGDTSYKVTGLSNGTTYTFTLTATNAIDSTVSAEVTGIPKSTTTTTATPDDTTDTSSDTTTDGDVTVETESTTTTNDDGSVTTETVETATNTETGEVTSTVSTETTVENEDGSTTTAIESTTTNETTGEVTTTTATATTTTTDDGATVTETVATTTNETTGAVTESTSTETVTETATIKEEVATTTTAAGDVIAETTTVIADTETATEITATVATENGETTAAEIVAVATEGSSDVTIPQTVLETVAAEETATITVETEVATIELCETATNTVADAVSASEDTTVVITAVVVESTVVADEILTDLENIVVVDLTISVGGENVSSFNGGTAKVSIPYTPVNEGAPITLYYVADDGSVTLMDCTYDAETGTIIFETGHFSYYMVSENTAISFADVAVNAYYYDAVKWAVDLEITNGTNEAGTTFSPEADCTRGQIVTFLYRAFSQPDVTGDCDFTDVAAGEYYTDAVIWAVANGITDGMGDGLFAPEAICTRGQIVTFLYRAAGEPAVEGTSDFTDVDADAYYADAVLWAVQNGITLGTGDGEFSPDDNCTRGQIVTFLYRYMGE